MTRSTALAVVILMTTSAFAQDAAHEEVLIHRVRQDCGSCHGMHLTGGLGPALTREALAGKPAEFLAATIYHGRPGTTMPPWKALLSLDDAQWIARQLVAGFPEEKRTSP